MLQKGSSNLVVTGANGYLGKRVVSDLKASGFNVIEVDISHPENPIDLSDLKQLWDLDLPPDYLLIHLAFPLPGRVNRRSFQKQIRMINENLVSRFDPVDFLFISSTAVYGLDGSLEQRPGPWEVYGELKLESEILFAQNFKKITVFRPGTLVELSRDSTMMKYVKHLAKSPVVVLPGSGELIHPFTNTADLVAAIHQWVTSGSKDEVFFDLVANDALTLNQLSHQLRTKRRWLTIHIPKFVLRKLGSDKYLLFGISKWHFSALTYNYQSFGSNFYTEKFLKYSQIFKI